MPAFEYRSLDHRGKVRKGVLEADSARQIRQQLRDKGWVPLEVEQASDKGRSGSITDRFSRRGRLDLGEQALVTRQLATLLRSGIPVEQALAAVARQSGEARIERIILAVRARVVEGHSLAAALAEFPRAFPEMYRATIAAGEQSGHLEQVAEHLAEYLETRHDTGRSVAQSMVYPAFIMLFSFMVIGFLLAFVVPEMVAVFDARGQALPLLTQVMIVASDLLRQWFWLLALLAGAGVTAFARAMQEPAFRQRVHRRLAGMPLVGKLLRSADAARLATTLGILSRSGVPLVDALVIASQVVSNLQIREAVRQAANRVREGGNLSRGLDESGYFPPMLIQMIASGESSGDLDQMLTRAGEYQERELNSVVSTLVNLLGPAMLLFMAAVVVMIVLAVLLPIMQMNEFMNV
jgi:general secretion pathway protein F